jgi:hypothetical protein
MPETENELEINLEELAVSIEKVSRGFQALEHSRLKQKTIVLLLQSAIGSTNITKKQIESVLEYAPRLEELYLAEEL